MREEVAAKYPYLVVPKGKTTSGIPIILGPDGTELKNASTVDALTRFHALQQHARSGTAGKQKIGDAKEPLAGTPTPVGQRRE
jgi:hypothetical protein